MTSVPLVSIVVPVFNVEDHLSACVSSLLSQTYRNLEIILVDDGSTDGSGALCDAFARENEHSEDNISVTFVHQENQGLCVARNVGIDLSRGDYITFVDSDDVIAPSMIEEMVRLGQSHNADCVGCSCRIFHRDDELAQYAQWPEETPRIVTGAEALHLLYSGLVPCFVRTSWGFLYKKSVLPTDRPPFPPGKYHEDEFTTHEFLYPLKTVVVHPKPLYFYRQRDNSITDADFKMIQIDKIEAGFCQVDYFHKAGDTFLEQLAAAVALERCIRFWDRVQRSDEFRSTAGPLIEEIYDTCYGVIKKRNLELGCFTALFDLFAVDRDAAVCAAKAAAASLSMSFEEGNFTSLAPATIQDVRLDSIATLFELFLDDPEKANEVTKQFMVDAEPGFPADSLIGLIDESNRCASSPQKTKPRRSLLSRAIRKALRKA